MTVPQRVCLSVCLLCVPVHVCECFVPAPVRMRTSEMRAFVCVRGWVCICMCVCADKWVGGSLGGCKVVCVCVLS